MDIERAKKLLSALADGVNPLTGELLGRDSVCNRPEIVRVLNTAVSELDKLAKKRAKKPPENAGKPWTEEDETALCQMFDSGATRRELCGHFKRTPGAIASRLVQLGRLRDREDFFAT